MYDNLVYESAVCSTRQYMLAFSINGKQFTTRRMIQLLAVSTNTKKWS